MVMFQRAGEGEKIIIMELLIRRAPLEKYRQETTHKHTHTHTKTRSQFQTHCICACVYRMAGYCGGSGKHRLEWNIEYQKVSTHPG